MNMDEWELSKENVQPLKSGRKVANLTAALQLQTQPNNVDRQQIILQRQALEADLRSYAGDDPIVPWENYIQWTEQTFPKGGNRKESNLRLLLERCVQQFKDDPRYKNDARYVSAWIKLAINFSTDPFEMFQFMRDQGIGFQVADFYEAWASQLEQVGNTTKADTVYQEGINCKAVPLDRLQSLHREFQCRVARSTMQQLQEGQLDTEESSSGPQRTALGGLKGKGKHQKVGTQRTGAAASKKAGPGIFGLQASNNQLGQQFSVFDENSAPSASSLGATALPAPTGEWENMPTREQAYKENEQSAGPWTGQRVRQRSTVGMDEVSSFRKPSFSVHVDDVPQPITTPHKLPEIGNQVLSARKPEKQTDNPLKNIQKGMSGVSEDGKSKVMYCKHLIYGGATEMSFEELRAIKAKAKREEQRLIAEREALLKRQAEIEEQHQLMLQKQMDFERKVQERLEQQQMRHEEELKRFQEQFTREQEMKKILSTQPVPQQENGPVTSTGFSSSTQNAVLSTRAQSIDQENQPMNYASAPTQNAVLSARAQSIDQENQPMNYASAPMQNGVLSARAQSIDQENQPMNYATASTQNALLSARAQSIDQENQPMNFATASTQNSVLSARAQSIDQENQPMNYATASTQNAILSAFAQSIEMRHEEELKRFQEQFTREQEMKKILSTQPVPQQENGPVTSAGFSSSTQNAVLSTRAQSIDQENQPMNYASAPTQNAVLSARAQSIDQENQPMNYASAPMQNGVLSARAQSIDQENQPMNYATASTQNALLSARAQSIDQENQPMNFATASTQNAVLSARAQSIDQENQPMNYATASTQNAILSAKAQSIDQENQPMNYATAPTQNAVLSSRAQSIDQENQPMSCAAPSFTSQSQPRNHDMSLSQAQHHRPIGAPTPEEKHSMTVDRAKQQLRELQQQTHHHQYGNGHGSHEEHDPANISISCTTQLQYDETRTVDMNQLHAFTKSNEPTPSFSKPPPLNLGNIITPNASAIFNTSSNNASQAKTPLNKSWRPDSRASSHSGRLSRITPSHTPGGITAPSPTVNTKEAFGVIMAMLNNPLHVDADEGWRPGAAAGNRSSIMEHDFESEFAAKEEPQPPKKCAFTIAVDEDAYMDNQENNPPKDYVAPGPDTRPRSGILQPSIGVPVQPLEAEDKENTQVDHHEEEEMDGIEPIKPDEIDQVQRNSTQHEATMMHHSTHSAFEAAARMASTPFNPQSGLAMPSFSMTPMSSIKAPMDASLHRPLPTSAPLPVQMNESLHRPVPTSAPLPVQMNESLQRPLPTSAPLPVQMNESLHRPVPTSATIPSQMNANLHRPMSMSAAASVPTTVNRSIASGIQQRSPCFSIAVDPVPTSVPMSCDPALVQEPMVANESACNNGAASRVEVSGLESFGVDETTINQPRHLSPIMETSSEDNPSSASSSNGSHQSQTQVALTASHIQPHSTIDKENHSLHTSIHSTTKQSNNSKDNCSVPGAGSNLAQMSSFDLTQMSQMSSFVSVRKSTSSSQGSESKYDLGSEFEITKDDVFTSTKLHQSRLDTTTHQSGLDTTARAPKENDGGDDMLAHDMSSLLINDPSTHHSMTHGGDVSMPPQIDQNQSWLNQSSAMNYTSRVHHESRLDQDAAAPNVSVLQPLDRSISTRPGGEEVAEKAAVVETATIGIDPWDADLKQSLLASTVPCLSSYPGYTAISNSVPDIQPGLAVSLGNEIYTISEKIGEGAYAKVYSAGILNADDFELEGDGGEVAIKVESPPCPWEFYISQQLHVRTKELDGIDVSHSLMDIKNAYIFNNASCLVTDLHTSGTLLDAINLFNGKGLPEPVALYFTIELMRTVEKMHAAGIIHGDIKPDNIMLTNLDDDNSGASAIYQSRTKYLKIIDMGRGIDMRLLPRGTVFTGKSGTSGCDCIEMKTGRPWTYQADLYGLAVTIVCMVCGTYMKTFEEGGKWRTTAKWKRWDVVDWKEIIESLINIPSCDELPSLSDMCQSLEDTFRNSIGEEKFASLIVRLSAQL